MTNGIDYAIRIAGRLMMHIDNRTPLEERRLLSTAAVLIRDLYDKKKQLEDDLALCGMHADQAGIRGVDALGHAARVSDHVGRMREELLAARNGVERLEDGESRERIAQAIFGDCALKYESCYRLAGKVVEALKEAR